MSTVAIHVDGGEGVGLGHATRGIGLAYALKSKGYLPVFVVASDPALLSFLEENNCKAINCAPTLDGLNEACRNLKAVALVIDSYRFDGREISALRARGVVLACFDDKADRELPVDVVINGSPAATRLPYRTKPETRRLFGLAYQVVRPEFIPDPSREYSGRLHSIVVTIGGDDLLGIFRDLLRFFERRFVPKWANMEIHFIIGPFFNCPDGHLPSNFRLYRSPKDIRSLMVRADIAVSAGGQTLFELARCGVPTVAVCVADDQLPNLQILEELGAIEYVGWAGETGWMERLALVLDQMCSDTCYRAERGRRASTLIDGRGAFRVADVIHELVSLQHFQSHLRLA